MFHLASAPVLPPCWRAPVALALAACAAGCGEALVAPPLPDDLVLYYPQQAAALGDGRHAWLVNTDFDRRFRRGWVSLFDAAAWAASPAAPAAGLRRVVQVPGLAGQMERGDGQWFLSHRGVGVVTVLDAATAGGAPSLSCGAPDGGLTLPVDLAFSDCDRAHLVDLPQAFVGQPGAPPSRSLLDAAALVYLPASSATPAWPHDRLLVGSLRRDGHIAALELLGGAGGVQAQVLGPALRLGLGLGSMLSVPPDAPPTLAAAAAAPAGPQVMATSSSGDTSLARSVGGGRISRLNVAADWGKTSVAEANVTVPLAEPLGGAEVVALAAHPSDDGRLFGISHGPDAFFELRREGQLAGVGDTLFAGSRWAQSGLSIRLPHSGPQALALMALPAGVFAVVAGSRDDSLTFIDVDAGHIARALSLGDPEAPQGTGPAGVAHLPLVPQLTAGATTLDHLVVVPLFFRHQLAVVDVSGGDPSAFSLLGRVAGGGLPPARRYR